MPLDDETEQGGFEEESEGEREEEEAKESENAGVWRPGDDE
jgi:hypothetical protein